MYFPPCAIHIPRVTRPQAQRLRLQLAAVCCAAFSMLMASTATSDEQASRDPDALEFAVEGVGKGTFDDGVLTTESAQARTGASRLCVTLAGGSRNNSPALLNWVSSNDAGAALASRPDATLKVPRARKGLEAGTYHFSGITIQKFTMKSDRDLTNPRLDGVEVKCEAMTGPSV